MTCTHEPKHAKGMCKTCYKKAYYQKPEVKAYMKAYYQKPERKAYVKAYNQKPEVKERIRELATDRALENARKYLSPKTAEAFVLDGVRLERRLAELNKEKEG